MSAMQFLEQLLKSGTSAMSGVGKSASGRKDLLTGAAAGGALGLLLGSGGGRRMGGKLLKYGSVAALGALAWQAYSQHQAKQTAAAGGAAAGAAIPSPVQTVDRLPAPQAEPHARAMLAAMIAAAKSDGHLDERERGMLDGELQRLNADPELQRWMQAELNKPIDPAAVARGASTPEMAAEVYLASLVVVDDTTPMERAYLDALARELALDPALKADLEARVKAV